MGNENLMRTKGEVKTWEIEEVEDPNDEQEFRRREYLQLDDEHDKLRYMEKILEKGSDLGVEKLADDYVP
jgi:hypothetical protein